MDCEQARGQLAAHVDCALPPDEAAAVELHLAACQSCAAEIETLKRVSRVVHSLPLRPLPEGFLARLRARQMGKVFPFAAWLGPRPLAFAAAVAVIALVVAGPWQHPSQQPEQTGRALPPLKTRSEPLELAMDSLGAASAKARSPSASFSNEQLHALLEEESSRAGMVVLSKGQGIADEPQAQPFLGDRLGQPGTREQVETSIRQLSAMRQAVEEASDKKPTVPIEGSVVPVLRGRQDAGSQAIGSAAPAVAGSWSGDYAGSNEGARAIEGVKAWSDLWRSLSASPAPAVDFANSEVVAVFLGPRPTGGYAVEFVDTERLPDALLVRWRERPPESGQSPPAGATSPYALKVIPRADVSIHFEKVR